MKNLLLKTLLTLTLIVGLTGTGFAINASTQEQVKAVIVTGYDKSLIYSEEDGLKWYKEDGNVIPIDGDVLTVDLLLTNGKLYYKPTDLNVSEAEERIHTADVTTDEGTKTVYLVEYVTTSEEQLDDLKPFSQNEHITNNYMK